MVVGRRRQNWYFRMEGAARYGAGMNSIKGFHIFHCLDWNRFEGGCLRSIQWLFGVWRVGGAFLLFPGGIIVEFLIID